MQKKKKRRRRKEKKKKKEQEKDQENLKQQKNKKQEKKKSLYPKRCSINPPKEIPSPLLPHPPSSLPLPPSPPPPKMQTEGENIQKRDGAGGYKNGKPTAETARLPLFLCLPFPPLIPFLYSFSVRYPLRPASFPRASSHSHFYFSPLPFSLPPLLLHSHFSHFRSSLYYFSSLLPPLPLLLLLLLLLLQPLLT